MTPKRVEKIFDYYWSLTADVFPAMEEFPPMIEGIHLHDFFKDLGYVPKPLLNKYPSSVKSTLWENPLTRQFMYGTAYEEAKHLEVDALILVSTATMSRVKYAFAKSLGYDPEALTAKDIHQIVRENPDSCIRTDTLQFNLDIRGKFYHAYCEIYPNGTLGEYVFTPRQVTTESSDYLQAARKKVFKST